MNHEFRLVLPLAEGATGADVAAIIKDVASSAQLPIAYKLEPTAAYPIRNKRGYFTGQWSVFEFPDSPRGIADVCFAGEPPIDGISGDLGCVCAPPPRQDEV